MINKKNIKKKEKKKKSGKALSRSTKRSLFTRLKYWFLLCVVAVVLFVSAMGVYLDDLVRQRFAGQLFTLPTVVYARILTLSPGMHLSLEALKNELEVLDYRKVSHPSNPGEYSSSSTKIELFRRPFEFADDPEPSRHVMLTFDGESLLKIQSLENRGELGYLRLDPKLLGMLDDDEQQRLFLRREQFPEVMVDALLATEDKNFYQHDGISLPSIGRAFLANLRAGRTVQGGSTLTQQLAKNIFLTQERSFWRKFKEAYMAIIMDYRYSKDRILEAYLNEVYLGQNGGDAVHGFGLASRLYFGQPLNELRIDQLALLVGMVKGPSYYNPQRWPDRATKRRNLVLKLMEEQGLLTEQQYESFSAKPLDVQAKSQLSSKQPTYFQQVKNELKAKVGDKFQDNAGLKVFTTLDPVSQHDLELAVSKKVADLETISGNGLQAAAIAVDRITGEIRAMIGGKNNRFDGFNRALNASRQIGSLAKPAVYLSALSDPKRYNLATTLVDRPMDVTSDKGQVWSPKNYDRKFRDQVPLYRALADSLNVPTVALGLDLGISVVMESFEKLGVNKAELTGLPSMFLGAFTLTPLEVGQMYQTLSNGGRMATLSALRTVVDLDNRVIYQSIPSGTQRLPVQSAWLVTYAMQQGVLSGTGRYLNTLFPTAHLAGKTGTSNDTRDSWFVGIDGREVTTVWLGRDDNKSTRLTGASGALRVYADYLTRRGAEPLILTLPEHIVPVKFKQEADQTLEKSCDGMVSLPVWDPSGEIAGSCDSLPKRWFDKFF